MSFMAPDRDRVFRNFLALLPPGKAWQSEEPIIDGPGDSILWKFWYAVAAIWQPIEQKAVDMLLEFSCDTTADDVDGWLADYNDECELASFDLCLKVHESGGGQDLTFYENVATTLGYIATFEWLKGDNTAYPGVYSSLLVTVDSASSPSFGLVPVGEFVVGDDRLGGAGGTELLSCILARMVPAHIELIYVIV